MSAKRRRRRDAWRLYALGGIGTAIFAAALYAGRGLIANLAVLILLVLLCVVMGLDRRNM